MKFKGTKDWRELVFTDNYNDTMNVSVARDTAGKPRVYISAPVSVSLGRRQARELATKILKELSE